MIRRPRRSTLLPYTTLFRSGGFNTSVVRAAKARIAELLIAGHEVEILCIGRKGRDQLKRDHGRRIIDTIENMEKGGLGFDKAMAVAKRLVALYDDDKFDICTVFFNRFKSVISQEVTVQRLIPFAASDRKSAV